MRVLFNIPWVSQSSQLELLVFGPESSGALQYDYQEPWSEWLARVLPLLGPVDALLFYLPEVYQLPPGLEQSPLPTVAILSDWNLNFTATMVSLQCFDQVLVDRRGFQVLRRMGFPQIREFNPYGLHLQEEPLAQQESVTEKWDALFIGNIAPGVQKERGAWLRRLLRLQGQMRVRVETGVYGQEFRDALASAKVVFNHSIRGEANMRVFETLCSGGIVFLENSNQEIQTFLDPERECVLYEESHMERSLLQLVQDSEMRESVRNAGLARRAVWGPAARWNALAVLLAECICAASVRPRPVESWQMCWLDWTAPVRMTPLAGVLARMDHKIQGDMRLEDAAQFIARCQLIPQPTSELVAVLERIHAAIQDTGRNTIWNRLHFARVLQKAGSQYLEREISLWIEILESLAHPAPFLFEGFPFYPLPESRHADFQAALWNTHCPQAFPQAPDVPLYLQHWALHRLGEIFIELGDSSQGLDCLRRSVQAFGRHPATWLRMAEVLQSQPQERAEAFARAFDIDPMNPECGVDLLEAWVRNGTLQEARSLRGELEGLFDLQCRVYALDEGRKQNLRARLEQISILVA